MNLIRKYLFNELKIVFIIQIIMFGFGIIGIFYNSDNTGLESNFITISTMAFAVIASLILSLNNLGKGRKNFKNNWLFTNRMMFNLNFIKFYIINIFIDILLIILFNVYFSNANIDDSNYINVCFYKYLLISLLYLSTIYFTNIVYYLIALFTGVVFIMMSMNIFIAHPANVTLFSIALTFISTYLLGYYGNYLNYKDHNNKLINLIGIALISSIVIACFYDYIIVPEFLINDFAIKIFGYKINLFLIVILIIMTAFFTLMETNKYFKASYYLIIIIIPFGLVSIINHTFNDFNYSDVYYAETTIQSNVESFETYNLGDYKPIIKKYNYKTYTVIQNNSIDTDYLAKNKLGLLHIGNTYLLFNEEDLIAVIKELKGEKKATYYIVSDNMLNEKICIIKPEDEKYIKDFEYCDKDINTETVVNNIKAIDFEKVDSYSSYDYYEIHKQNIYENGSIEYTHYAKLSKEQYEDIIKEGLGE